MLMRLRKYVFALLDRSLVQSEASLESGIKMHDAVRDFAIDVAIKTQDLRARHRSMVQLLLASVTATQALGASWSSETGATSDVAVYAFERTGLKYHMVESTGAGGTTLEEDLEAIQWLRPTGQSMLQDLVLPIAAAAFGTETLLRMGERAKSANQMFDAFCFFVDAAMAELTRQSYYLQLSSGADKEGSGPTVTDGVAPGGLLLRGVECLQSIEDMSSIQRTLELAVRTDIINRLQFSDKRLSLNMDRILEIFKLEVLSPVTRVERCHRAFTSAYTGVVLLGFGIGRSCEGANLKDPHILLRGLRLLEQSCHLTQEAAADLDPTDPLFLVINTNSIALCLASIGTAYYFPDEFDVADTIPLAFLQTYVRAYETEVHHELIIGLSSSSVDVALVYEHADHLLLRFGDFATSTVLMEKRIALINFCKDPQSGLPRRGEEIYFFFFAYLYRQPRTDRCRAF